MKTHLFYSFLAIYLITAALALIGITGILSIRDGYLAPLMSAFLIESAGAVVAVFRRADFFSPEPSANLEHTNRKAAQKAVANERIEIRSAHYGTAHAQIDVTESVRRHVRDGTLNILVTNEEVCPGRDPAYNYTKGLTINYTLGGRDRTIQVIEGSSLILP
jgi:hypothetical protein